MILRIVRSVVVVVLLGSMGLAGGCGPGVNRTAVPQELANQAVIPGYSPLIRTWGDAVSLEFQESCFAEAQRQRQAFLESNPNQKFGSNDVLCISGGGEFGAFGAGLLNGWSERGDRPNFVLVTGVSTGALTAPMAFVGGKYDDRLREAYTTVSRRDIMLMRPILTWLRADSTSDTRPLVDLIARFVDQEMLDIIAVEHAKGRRLLISTVDLDAQRPVIWDMGAIASSGQPSRLKLFREVLRASASIPVLFSPMYFEVQAGDKGNRYHEMHVDGGTMMQVFFLGSGVDPRNLGWKAAAPGQAPGRVFVLRNSRFTPEHEAVRPNIRAIATRSIATLIMAQGLGDVIRIYSMAKTLGLEYRLIAIPEDFTETPDEPFDTKFMNKLYKRGFQVGLMEDPWLRAPPFGTLERSVRSKAGHSAVEVAPATAPAGQ